MKLGINHKANTEKHAKTWKINNMLSNNDIKGKIKRYLETNENEETATPNLWDTQKAILRGKFIALQAYLKNKKKFK